MLVKMRLRHKAAWRLLRHKMQNIYERDSIFYYVLFEAELS